MIVSKSAKAFRLLIAGALAASVTVLPISGGFAAGEALGAKCTNEGESTGTFSTSLVCAKNSAGRLVWTKVKLSSSNLGPINALRAPRGSIEFWHWRAEDKAWFDKIIADFEALNPGVKISQVISNSVDYQATAIQKSRTNKKAALFTTFRGAQFNTAATTDFYADLTNEQFAKRNVIKSMMGAGQYNGKQLGIPYQSLFNNPIYNIEIFKKEGWKLPKKFSEWISYCKTAKAAGYTTPHQPMLYLHHVLQQLTLAKKQSQLRGSRRWQRNMLNSAMQAASQQIQLVLLKLQVMLYLQPVRLQSFQPVHSRWVELLPSNQR